MDLAVLRVTDTYGIRLRLQGISVPRSVVRNLIKQLDLERVQERKAHKLQRRTYRNRGQMMFGTVMVTIS